MDVLTEVIVRSLLRSGMMNKETNSATMSFQRSWDAELAAKVTLRSIVVEVRDVEVLQQGMQALLPKLSR